MLRLLQGDIRDIAIATVRLLVEFENSRFSLGYCAFREFEIADVEWKSDGCLDTIF